MLNYALKVAWRRQFYYSLVLLTALFALSLLTTVFNNSGGGITPLELLLLALYGLLTLWLSCSFWTATLGFFVRWRNTDPLSLSARSDWPMPDSITSRTALVMPIYNEDPTRVFARLRAIYQSLQETSYRNNIDIFILSDTRDADFWVEEEIQWYRMCQELNAHGKVFYRNREKNTSRKSGNLSDFITRWGSAYEYMIVLDADSLMGSATLIHMVQLMEANPKVALIQSPPLPIGNNSLFARVLQFSSSLFGGMFSSGLAFWQLAEGNYWGHNAIIRIKPFAAHCGLPKLPGEEPLGGEILSHDFVESALLRKQGWEVWLVPELNESFEELPPTLIDYAKRDRRWCQGNLQHSKLLFAKGLKSISKLHLIMGIMSYLSSPLWLIFLVVTGIEAYVQSQTELDYFIEDSLFPVWPESYTVEMTTVLIVTLSMLFLPKFLGIFLLFKNRTVMKNYGGFIKASLSVFLETIFSTLIAPILMLYQSKFVISILFNQSVGWPAQQRADHRLSLKDGIRAHGMHTLFGLVAGYFSYYYVTDYFWWLIPVLTGLVLAVPVSIYSSSAELGIKMRAWGLFLTPFETNPPEVINAMQAEYEHLIQIAKHEKNFGARRAVIDPAIHALHLAMLPKRVISKRHRYHLRTLVYQLLEDGPDTLTTNEKRMLLYDPDTLSLLHTLAWSEKRGDAG